MLFLHLLPDGVYALRPSFDMELQSGGFQMLLHRAYEPLYICVACTFGGIEVFFYLIVGVVLQIFQAQVLQLALQLVQSELMGKGRIEIAGLFRHLVAGLFVRRVANLPHEVHAVGNHYQYDAHILSET